ncbi:FAD-binding protein, partial [Mycobacterium sp.]|uniref:FAD-binding oxidoreductase n=1 Tax=Mycobacterium sp. TaxID=1785 RepID=UPI00263645A2
MSSDALASLIADLPEGMVITDAGVTEGYRQDRAFDPSAGKPLAVVRPRRTEEVQTVLRWAAAHRVPVVTRGAGSGLSGGATALDNGIVLSTEKMRDVAVDPVTRTAVCQPGLFNAEVKKAAAEHGLWYPPDPSSFEICSIGGNIATNAGGLCCVKYGVTTDYVLGMQVVLADGTAVRLGGPRLKDVAGLSLTKLFVGSEGTLGVVTEVTLRLVPKQNASSIVVAGFSSVQDAVDAVLGVTARLRPSMLEFMDSVAINAVEDTLRMDLDRQAAAMLVAGSDERGRAGSEDAEIMAKVFADSAATEVFSTDDPDEGEAFVAARRFCIPAVEAKGSLMLEDVGVPLPALGRLVTGI